MIQSKNWIPHNLPPRSEFIGREEAKALVHEALRSRSYLISIDGIGGIGKTSLALEVAYECLQVSQYVKQLSRTTSAPEPVFVQEVVDLPPQLYNRLQSTLLKCGPFDSEVELWAMFVDARISPWRDTFPEMRNRVSRVNVLIDELLHRYATTGENAVLLFLQVLKEQVSAGDTCYNDLSALAAELEHILKGQRNNPDTCLKPPDLPPSLDMQKIAHFEGFIWATAKDRTLSLNDLLDAIARTLDYHGIAQTSLEEKRLAVEKLLRMQPSLLIVDNYETINDAAMRDFLLDLPEPSKALITTREQKLGRVWAISLKGLTEVEAVALMRNEGRRVGMTALVQASETTLLQLYEATGGTPLAIKWAVGQIKQKGQSFDAVLAALHGAEGNIFDHIFGRSWSLLSDDARRVLMVMPLFAFSASYDAIEATSSVHHFALDAALGQLVEMALIEPTDALRQDERRYSIHPLTRSFALANSKQYAAFMKTSRENLVDFMQALVDQYAAPWTEEGFKRLNLEFPIIAEVIRWCWDDGETGNPLIGFHILSEISDFLITLGYWDEAVSWSEKAITLAEEMGEEGRAAQFRAWPLSCVLRHRGNLARAEIEAENAMETLQRVGDELLAVWAKRNLARVYQESGRLDQAEKLLREALSYAKKRNFSRTILLVTANLAIVLVSKGELDTAQSLCEEVLSIAKESGDAERLAHLLGVLAGIALRRGELEKAKVLSDSAMIELQRVGRQDFIAFNQVLSAKIEIALGNVVLARQQLTEALESYRRLYVPSSIQEIQMLLASLPDKDAE